MVEWNECIEDAKRELGIYGWTDRWNEVINLAKERYWKGKTFKDLKEDTIYFSDRKIRFPYH